MKDLKDMSVRKEFVELVLDKLEECMKASQTNGESKVLYLMAEAMNECLEWEE